MLLFFSVVEDFIKIGAFKYLPTQISYLVQHSFADAVPWKDIWGSLVLVRVFPPHLKQRGASVLVAELTLGVVDLTVEMLIVQVVGNVSWRILQRASAFRVWASRASSMSRF